MAVSAHATGTHTPTSKNIESSTNASPIVVTSTAHGFSNGDIVYIVGHGTNTNANGTWTVANVAADTFELSGSTGNGVGGATGTILKVAETFVSDVNVTGVFVFEVDLNAMAAGDIVELRVYIMVLTSGTARVFAVQVFNGEQPTDDKIKVSIPVANQLTDSTALRVSIKQTHGVARAMPWKVLKVIS